MNLWGRLLLSMLVPLSAFGAADETNFFYPVGYENARSEFRRVAQQWKEEVRNSTTGVFLVPSTIDSDLTVDYLYVPAGKSPDNLIVVTSGVHGPESFAGSAVQIGFLRKSIGELSLETTGLLFIHSVNPYGFKYLRRQTEENVDLNRNMATDPFTFELVNEGYMSLKPILEPEGIVAGVLGTWARTVWGLGKELVYSGFKMNVVNEAVARGQYSSPKGLFYGGKAHEPQIGFLKSLGSKIIQKYDRVVGLDFHTGLGKAGELHLMTGRRVNRENYEERVGSFLKVGLDQDVYSLTPSDTEGFYFTSGDVIDFLPTLARDSSRAFAFTAEYGTLGNGFVPKLRTITRMILENQGHHFGYSNAKIKNEVRSDFLELFNPSDLRWRETVVSKGEELIKRIYTRMETADRAIASENP